MLATLINTLVIVLGSLLGTTLGNRLKAEHTKTLIAGLGICTLVIGITGAIATENILLVIVCIALGTILGEALKIETGLDKAGNWLKAKVAENGGNRFTEGFVTASLLFCVGSMAVMGSFDAGLRGNYDTILAKSALDCVMAVTFSATMGIGVAFSALTVLVYQGALTLLAGAVEPLLTPQIITEMSAVGGIMLIATGLNILELPKTRLRVGNMLPALFLPIIWFLLRGYLL